MNIDVEIDKIRECTDQLDVVLRIETNQLIKNNLIEISTALKATVTMLLLKQTSKKEI